MADPTMADGCAFIEGKYVPIGEARIPLLDAGFLRSDVTYDVAGVWKGKWFRLDAHMERFQRSYTALRMQLPYTLAEMTAHLTECVRRSDIRDAYAAVVATRGLGRAGSRDLAHYKNSFIAYVIPYVWILPRDTQAEGMHAIISSVRRIPPESFDPTVKNFLWGDLVRGAFEAKDRGARTGILVDDHGNLTEGPGYNVFVVSKGKLFTPVRGVLEGITRRTLLELAAANGIAAEETLVSPAMAHGADEVFACSTAGGIMPITTLDGAKVGNGKPGPLTQRLDKLYWNAHDDPRWSSAIDYGT